MSDTTESIETIEEDYDDPFFEYSTEQEILNFFGTSKQSLYNLRKTGGLPYIPVTSTSRLYHVATTKQWLNDRMVNGTVVT